MIPTEAPTTSGRLERDVLARERFATLTCPNCLGTLQIKANIRAAAPCPICRYPLRYDPPTAVPAEPFTPKQEPTKAIPRHRKRSPLDPIQSFFREADDFINTAVGTALAWGLVAVLLSACVVLFFQWDAERRVRSVRMEAIESQRPAASHRPSTVPLLPGEPQPVDPMLLQE